MTDPLFYLGHLGISTEILLSIGLAILIAFGSCFWIKNNIGRGLILFLIVSAWWNAIQIGGKNVGGLDLKSVDTIPIFKIGNFVIGGTIFYSWLVMAVLVILSRLATRNLKTTLRVSALQTAMESVVRTIRSQIIDVSGDNPARYIPIMGTFFFSSG